MLISIIEYFKKTIKVVPNKIAIIDGIHKISFEELDTKSKSLAIELNRWNCTSKPIAVFLPKSIESIISDIAITYSGNAYMNLDIKTPSTRIGNILDLIKPEIVITNKNLASFINDSSFGVKNLT